jgi:hypothetical protein
MFKGTKAQQRRGWLFLLGFFILPHLIVIVSGQYEETGRILAVGLGLCTMLSAVLWMGLSPNSMILRLTGKLSHPEYDRGRRVVEVLVRALVLVVGITFAWSLVVPYLADVTKMSQGERPVRTQGRAIVERSRYNIWFLWERFDMTAGEARVRGFSLFYSFRPVRNEGLYDFTFLPRSKIVLTATRLLD